jgi:hypothetical protein
VAEHSLGRCARALGFVVGKKADAPDGSVAVFDLTGPLARQYVVAVEGGRAEVVGELGSRTPTVSLTMAAETLWCLGGGRWDPDQVLGAGRVVVDGDRELGERIVRSMNFMI